MVSLEFSCGEWYMISLARILEEDRHDHHVTGVVAYFNRHAALKLWLHTLIQRVAHIRSCP